MGQPATVRVSQVRGAHFVLNAPFDGQLYVAKGTVPLLFMFGGVVPEGARPCFDISCTAPGSDAAQQTACFGDAGVEWRQEGGQVRMDLHVEPGNCSVQAAVVDAGGQRMTEALYRRFRVVDEQAECPEGSGVACMHASPQADC